MGAQDLPLLCEAVLRSLGIADEAQASAFRGEGFLEQLRHHSWPGNVRELRNFIERCVVLGEPLTPEPGAEVKTPAIDLDRPLRELREEWVRVLERQYLERMLALHGNNARRRRARPA